MEKFLFNKCKKYIFITLCAIFIISAVFFFFSANNLSVYAENSTNDVLLQLPNTNLEYKTLRDPIDVYSDDYVTAIVQDKISQSDNTTLLIYQNGKFFEPLTNFKAIKQVKKANQNTLLISDGGIIYSLYLSDLTAKTELRTVEGEIIGGNYFDVSESYLVTAYGPTAFVYEKTADGYVSVGNFTVNGDYPVAVNEVGEIFYVSGNSDFELRYLSATDVNQSYYLADVAPSKMIANQDYVYFVQDAIVARISTNSKLVTPLHVDADMANYQLGNLYAPSSITFKNGNLLIADTNLDAVQEFAITDQLNLSFTGFAIASEKTAYNRITKNASDVEKVGNMVATLDENKLLVFNPTNENKYSRENFKNFFAEDLGGALPNAFTLGNGTALLSFGHGDTLGTLRLLNLTTGNLSDQTTIFTGNTIKDICYQSGFYYIYATTGETIKRVYKVSENDFTFDSELFSSTLSATHITADVFGNVYLANDVSGKIVFCDSQNDFQETEIGTIVGINKLVTDLGGKLYALADGALYVYDGTTLSPTNVDGYNDGDSIKSLAMDFEHKEVYLLYEQKEYICYTTELDNYALSEASVSDEYYVTNANTTDIDLLKSTKINFGANVYSVNRNGDGFDYNGLTTPENEYAYICDVNFNGGLTLCALAGRNGVVLANSNELSLSAPERTSAPQTAYVTTDVNVYFFPIINQNTDYTLKNENTIRLEKSTLINPVAKITFLDKEFYFANASVNGQNVFGYIPVDFTVEVLSEDFIWDKYTIVEVSATTLYSDLLLQTELQELSEGKEVRLISSENGTCKVAVKLEDGNFIIGYINSSAVKNEPNRAIRNILIILAVTASVCGTVTYFLLRKKG